MGSTFPKFLLLHLRCSVQGWSPFSLSWLLPLPAPFLRHALAARTSKGSPSPSSRPGLVSHSSGTLRMLLEVTLHLVPLRRHLPAASSWSHPRVSLITATCSSWFFLLGVPVHANLTVALYRMTADTAHELQLQGFANGDLTFQRIKFTGKCVYFLFFVANFTYPLIFQYAKLFDRLLYLWHHF